MVMMVMVMVMVMVVMMMMTVMGDGYGGCGWWVPRVGSASERFCVGNF